MSSESKALSWVANLSQQFDSFCSEAEAIIPQEPIEYLRNQFVTAGESLKQFYSEVLEDVFSVGCMSVSGPNSPRKEEEITDLTPSNVSHMSPLLIGPAGEVYQNYISKVPVVKNPKIETSECTSRNLVQCSLVPKNSEIEASECTSKNSGECSLVPECPKEIGKFEEDHIALEVDDYKLKTNEVSPVSSSASACCVEPTQTSDSGLSECVDIGESKEPINSDDEFCSETDCVSYQKTETLGKKYTVYDLLNKIVSRDFDDEETEANGWEKLDKDLLCDSDWEII